MTVANPTGSAEKLCHKESHNGVHTVLRGPKNSLKATIENAKGSVEKLSPKKSVEGAHIVRRGSVRAPKGFSKGNPRD